MVFRLSLSDVLEFYEHIEICLETCVYFYDFQQPPYRTTVLIRDHGAYNFECEIVRNLMNLCKTTRKCRNLKIHGDRPCSNRGPPKGI